jgi:hypothetical protein
MIPTVTRYSPMKPSTSAQPALPLSTNPTPSTAVHQRSGFSLAERRIALERLEAYLSNWNDGIDKRALRSRISDLRRKLKLQQRILETTFDDLNAPTDIDTSKFFKTAKQEKRFLRWKNAIEAFKAEKPLVLSSVWRTQNLSQYKGDLKTEIDPVVEALIKISDGNTNLDFSYVISHLSELHSSPKQNQSPTTIGELRKQEYRILCAVITRIFDKIPQ